MPEEHAQSLSGKVKNRKVKFLSEQENPFARFTYARYLTVCTTFPQYLWIKIQARFARFACAQAALRPSEFF